MLMLLLLFCCSFILVLFLCLMLVVFFLFSVVSWLFVFLCIWLCMIWWLFFGLLRVCCRMMVIFLFI